ncbi:hypothetical protein NAL12_12960, partial [Corynebacterium belfantii]
NNENLPLAAAAELGGQPCFMTPVENKNSALVRGPARSRLKPKQKQPPTQNVYAHWKKKTQSCANNEIIVRKATKYFAEETH